MSSANFGVSPTAAPPRPGRAHRVLRRLLDEAHLAPQALAAELVVSGDALQGYRDGAAIPLDRQLCLALLVIERVPALAREGHALRGQALAAIALNSGAVETHRDAPPPAWG